MAIATITRLIRKACLEFSARSSAAIPRLTQQAGRTFYCFLNSQLTCRSRTGFSSGPAAVYVVSESGVKVGNKVVSWVYPQQATALMPSIRERAKTKCDTVLFWQAKDKQNNRPTSIPAKMDDQEGCKPTLVQICASSGGKLDNGKDISNLCRP